MGGFLWALVRTVGLFRRKARARDLREELETHLSMLIDEYVDRGMSYAEARREAALSLGSRDAVTEEYFRVAGVPFIEHFIFDLKLSLANLRKAPGFALAIILTLSISVAVASVILCMVLFARIVPGYGPNARDVYVLADYARNRLGDWNKFDIPIRSSPAEYELLRSRTTAMKDISLSMPTIVVWQQNGQSRSVHASRVTPNFFRVLGVEANWGPAFGELRQDHSKAVVISDSMWKNLYATDPEIIGRETTVDRQKFTIVGVTPQGFTFPNEDQAWFPTALPSDEPERSTHRWDIFARLAPGFSQRSAEAQINAILAAAPDTGTPGWRVRLESLPKAYGGSVTIFFPLITAGAVVLIAAWVTVTLLLSARVCSRKSEFAIRMALGASNHRIVSQMLVQISLLAAAAGILAVPTTILVTPHILYWLSQTSLGVAQRLPHSAVSSGLFTLLLTAMSVAICGTGPALSVTRNPILSTSGISAASGRHWPRYFRHALVMCQVAFALVMFVGAGQMLRTFFVQWLRFDRDSSARNSLAVLVSVKNASSTPRAQISSLLIQALQSARSIPGVESATFATQLPFHDHAAVGRGIRLEDASAKAGLCWAVVQSISPDYMKQFSLLPVLGRMLHDKDSPSDAVAVINSSFAGHCFGSQNVLGKRIRLEDQAEISDWMIIVGIVGDRNISPFSSGSELAVYRPFQQEILTKKIVGPRYILLRTTGDAQQYSKSVSARLESANPNLKFYGAQSLTGLHEDSSRSSEAVAWLFAALGGIAALLAIVGVFSLLQHQNAERHRQIAISMMVGASARQILLAEMKSAGALLCVSLAAGLPLALLFGTFITKVLMAPIDGVLFVYGALLIGICVLVGACAPALSASKTDALSIMRCE